VDNVKEKEAKAPVLENFILRMGLPDVLRLTMFGTLIAITNDITRLPLHLPGHTSIWWMGILVLGIGLIPKFGAGIIMGVISGVLAVLLGLGKEGVFVFFKYFIPGLLIDMLAPFFYYKFENPFIGAICGTFASLSKLAVNLGLGVLLKLPMGFIALGLGFSSLSHTIFGAAGGAVAAILIKRLKPRLTSWE
jgi:ABC-type thiamin/hydroxymethylpyrimidine transport system permease subunit